MNSIALTYPVTRRVPRLSRAAGFWAVALSFLTLGAFATAPSALYGLYAQQQGLSGLTLTIVYAIYAGGIVVSLVLAGHLSDVYGRRALFIPGLAIAAVAAVVFIVWQSLPGLIVARVLTGVALGLSAATATAYIADLDSVDGEPTRRSGIVATVANVGGLAVGPLIAGVLAQYTTEGLTLPYVLLLVALVGSVGLVAWSPEGREPVDPRPAYRPQRLRVPAHARSQFIGAATGALLVFAFFGLFAGLAGRLLAGPLHHPSAALTGLAIFVNFGAGIVVQTTTTHWPARRLIAAGLAPTLVGLIVLVASAWTASLALFFIAAVVGGAGGGAIFRGSLVLAVSTAAPAERASALATFFTASYVGVSLPVIGLGVALQYVSPNVALLIFAVIVGAGILAAAPVLTGAKNQRPKGER
jgi:MFS family permease